MGIRRKAIDMAKGPILRNVMLFALPLVFGNILQQLYTTMGTLVIGAYLLIYSRLSCSWF